MIGYYMYLFELLITSNYLLVMWRLYYTSVNRFECGILFIDLVCVLLSTSLFPSIYNVDGPNRRLVIVPGFLGNRFIVPTTLVSHHTICVHWFNDYSGAGPMNYCQSDRTTTIGLWIGIKAKLCSDCR